VSLGRNPLWNTRVKDERGQDVFIPLLDAASYITEEFCAVLEILCVSENMGCLPFAGGWAEQPEWITRAIFTLKVERFMVDEEEREIERQEQEDAKKYGRR
jgi:hypothetical protein